MNNFFDWLFPVRSTSALKTGVLELDFPFGSKKTERKKKKKKRKKKTHDITRSSLTNIDTIMGKQTAAATPSPTLI